MPSRRLLIALLSTLACALALPAIAAAATRYAAPNGTGALASCEAAAPCSLTDALAAAQLHDGDEVVVTAGQYSLTSGIQVQSAVNVHGETPGAPPVISVSGFSGFLSVSNAGARIADLHIVYSGGVDALGLSKGTGERLTAHATGSASFGACLLGEATLRDSVCWNEGGPGVFMFTSSATTGRLRNVTAISTGTGANAHGVSVESSSGTATIDARGVIASGNDNVAADVRAAGNGSGTVNLANSAFDTFLTSGGGSVTAPGTNGNLTEDPLFVDAAAGDFHEAEGSPTIDTGAVDGFSGSLDLDGNPRLKGPAVDIGAYETEKVIPPVEPVGPRYASPTGTGPVADCPPTEPCSLADALDPAHVEDGDEVVIRPGDYQFDGNLRIDAAANVHGASSGAPPRLYSSTFSIVSVTDPGARIADVEIDLSGGGSGLHLEAGLAERLNVRVEDGQFTSALSACDVREAVLRDSVCWNRSGPGVSVSLASTIHPRLRNVTAIGEGSGEAGIYVSAVADAHPTLDARAVIAIGDDANGSDIYARSAENGTATMTFASSSYNTYKVGPGGVVTKPGQGSNIKGAPLFVDAAAGDFREAAGSPTINRGSTDSLTGALDLARNVRVAGAGIDIGAYEADATLPGGPGEEEEKEEREQEEQEQEEREREEKEQKEREQKEREEKEKEGGGGGGPGTGNGGGSSISMQLGRVAPDTVLVKGPRKRTSKPKVKIRFKAVGEATGFQCSIDKRKFKPCKPTYKAKVKPGKHRLRVRAVGPGGTDPTPLVVRWKRTKAR